jgi:hypothetical protein
MHTFARLLTLEPLERHPGRVLTVVGLVCAVAYVTSLTAFPRGPGRIINGDAIQYYAYLRSLVIDRDVDFTNDYRLLYAPTDGEAGENVWLTSRTETGRPPNMMSIGPALLWAPAFLATYAILVLLQPFGIAVPLDGMAAPFSLSAGVSGIMYATLGAYLCYRSCRLLFPDGPAFWGALVAWLATPALYYSLVSPAYSHAPSLFAAALFCYVWLKTRGNDGIGRYVWLGILAGLAALVRWQDVVILALPLLELAARGGSPPAFVRRCIPPGCVARRSNIGHILASRALPAGRIAGLGATPDFHHGLLARSVAKRRSPLSASALRAGVMLGGVVVMLMPQLVAWRAIYGHFLVMPQGGGFMQWAAPALVSVLFSLRHGLFSWTPAVLVAVLGFYHLVRRDGWLGWSVVVVVLLAVYINASVSDWWAGEAFGARRFVGYTVFFALGLAALFARELWQNRPVLLRWTAVALVVYNLLFLLQYQLFMRGFQNLAPYPTTMRQVLFDRLTLPWHLIRAWLGN